MPSEQMGKTTVAKSDKELVIDLLRCLPEGATLAEIVEELQTLAAIERGKEAARQGQVIPHEEARRRLEEWLSKSNGLTPPSKTFKTSLPT